MELTYTALDPVHTSVEKSAGRKSLWFATVRNTAADVKLLGLVKTFWQESGMASSDRCDRVTDLNTVEKKEIDSDCITSSRMILLSQL